MAKKKGKGGSKARTEAPAAASAAPAPPKPPTVSDATLEGIERHVKEETEREVGGVLVGASKDGRTRVDAWIPALKAVGGRANVTFTHEVWADVLAEMEAKHPGKKIVGWYHSHPGFGIFLSEYDLFIHRNFFSEPTMVAYVVDPLAGTTGWFGWVDGDVELVGEGRVEAVASTRPVASVPEARSGASRNGGLGVLLGALVVVAAFAIGYVIGGPSVDGGTGDPNAVVTPGPSSEGADVAALRAKIVDLRGRLRVSQRALRRPVLLYEVRRGDTLWRIAERFLGDGFDFPRIQRENEDVLRDGLEPGMVLRILLPGTLESASDPYSP